MRTIVSDDFISRQAAINAFMKATSDGDKADWCRWVLEQLPPAQPEPSQVARDIAAIIENEKDMRVIAQPEIIRCKDCKYADDDCVCQNSMGLVIQDDKVTMNRKSTQTSHGQARQS